MNYEVLAYTAESLASALSGKAGKGRYVQTISEEATKKKDHYKYFLSYFSDEGIGAKTIVVEREYVSKAYISDYSNYYSTCFQDYQRFCARVHFFNETFDQQKFHDELFKEDSDFLQKSYLGYIVVKPLPECVIGATILKTYGHAKDKLRHYNAIRRYDVNLFGRKLTIDSLAYQEQDTVVSACASTAIWNAFHKTAVVFQTSLPSPSEITKMAGNLYFNSGRTFPNNGLDITQIGKAVESVGLVSEIRIVQSDNPFSKHFVYAYSKAGLPVLLFISIGAQGYHLITVVGYAEKDEEPEKKEEISLRADRIGTFYAHDDQVGPFARIELTNSTALKTAWTDETGANVGGSIYAIIVPLYPKIRISFDDVFKKTNLIDAVLYHLDAFKFELEWDIFLSDSNKYKRTALADAAYSEALKHRIAFAHYPRYVWVARAYVKGILVFEFLFDSTDIARGFFGLDFHLIDQDAKAILKSILVDRSDLIFADDSLIHLGDDLFEIVKNELT